MAQPYESEQPLVDAIIPVHSPSRPVERAAASILDHTRAPVRVTVVIHNTDPGPVIARLSAHAEDLRLRVEIFEDGIPSPAGPMNRGLELATAPFVTLLGSDDTFEPHAIDAWLEAAGLGPGGEPADVVIAPIRGDTRGIRATPPIRPRRLCRQGARLDGVRDRLVYRTAPLGLIGRTRFGHLRFTRGVVTGEDQAFSAELWFTPGARVVFPVRAPGYREHDDQLDRVTRATRSVVLEFSALNALLAEGSPWSTDRSARLSLAVKLIRMHLFDALRNRLGHSWTEDEARELSAVAARIIDWEPRTRNLLARADESLLDAVLRAEVNETELGRLLMARTRLKSARALLPSRVLYWFHSQAPLRYHLAGSALRRFSA